MDDEGVEFLEPLRCTAAAVALSVIAVVGIASPASAAPVITGGLVNVTVTDVLNDTQVTVALPIAVAAAVCGVSVNVLAIALAPPGTQTVSCPSSTGTQTVTVSR